MLHHLCEMVEHVVLQYKSSSGALRAMLSFESVALFSGLIALYFFYLVSRTLLKTYLNLDFQPHPDAPTCQSMVMHAIFHKLTTA